jgi:hypothetical protein
MQATVVRQEVFEKHSQTIPLEAERSVDMGVCLAVMLRLCGGDRECDSPSSDSEPEAIDWRVPGSGTQLPYEFVGCSEHLHASPLTHSKASFILTNGTLTGEGKIDQSPQSPATQNRSPFPKR